LNQVLFFSVSLISVVTSKCFFRIDWTSCWINSICFV